MVIRNIKKLVHTCVIVWSVILSGCATAGTRNFNPIFFPEVEISMKVTKRPFLGIFMGAVPDQYITETVKKENSVYVRSVIPETPAYEAEVKTGDIIISADGNPFTKEGVEPLNQLKKTIMEKNIGDTIELSIIREGNPITLTAKIREERTIPPKIKAHPDIDSFQKTLNETDSVMYQSLVAAGRLDDFQKTLSVIRDKSNLTDSYLIAATENPFRLREINYLLHHPTNMVPVSRMISMPFIESFNTENYDLRRLIREMSSNLDVEVSLSTEDPPQLDSLNAFIDYVTAKITRAETMRKMAFKDLSEDDISFIGNESVNVVLNDEVTAEVKERLLKIAAKVDYQMLFNSMAEASDIVSTETINALRKLEINGKKKLRDIPTNIVKGDVVDIIETQFGNIIVGGAGRTHYIGNAFMIIDAGGDDIYENNAGASTMELHFSFVIDLAGNDKYITKANLAQGTGFMGTGILADMQGDDIYMGDRGAQGAGIFGGGILIDLDGDDRFIAESLAQGAGVFGIGMLINKGGNDIYNAGMASQGFATVKGFGVLTDLTGNDYYLAGGRNPDHRDPEHSTTSFSQGFAIGIRPSDMPVGASGGIGALIDKEGDDQYFGDYFAQGASYWYSLGILHDISGDDTYIAGRYAQGAGIHTSAGALIDEEGKDSYLVTFGVSQGMGHDFGVGVLADSNGNNMYKGGTLSLGAATCGGIGILYDRDSMDSLISERGQSAETPDDSCGAHGFGILLDERKGKIIQ